MKVLLTGAFGNVGSNTLRELISKGYSVTCFDLKNRHTLKVQRRFKDDIMTIWGDIRNREDVARAVEGQDVVLHLAAVIPPRSEIETKVSEETNICGTRNLIQTIKAQPDPPRLLFTSSVSVFGRKFDTPPPRRVGEKLVPTDNYSRHKIICEDMIQKSGLNYSILRCPAMPSLEQMGMDPYMFDISLDTRIEFLDPRDAGLAIANAIACDEVWGRILLLGGGVNEQYTYCEYMGRTLDAVGIGRLPCEAFGTEPFYTDWVDSTESQRLLKYQRNSLEDFLEAFKKKMGFKRHLLPLFRPLIRSLLLKGSKFLPAGLQWGYRRTPYWEGKVAVITGASSGIGAAIARILAAKGLKVALVARREEKLAQVAHDVTRAGGQVMVVVSDLSDPDERVRIINQINARWGQIDVLINNAGFAWYGYGVDMPWDTAARMIEVNVSSLVHLTLLVLGRMRFRNSGHIINVGSIAGSFPQQGISLYSATKSFIDNFTTSLYRELRKTDVHLSVIKPGAVATELYDPANVQSGGRRIPGGNMAIGVEKVARNIWSLLKHPRRKLFVPRMLWIVPWVEMLFGWFIDLLGPVLLNRRQPVTKPSR